MRRNKGSSAMRRSARDEKRVSTVRGLLYNLQIMAKPPYATRMEISVEAPAKESQIKLAKK
jgi:uncharacterized protein YqiB (DUF1249 family)